VDLAQQDEHAWLAGSEFRDEGHLRRSLQQGQAVTQAPGDGVRIRQM
jgi:hypothetical protein